MLARARIPPLDAPEGERAAWLAERRRLEGHRARSTPLGPRHSTRMTAPIKRALRLGLRTTGLWRRGLANGLALRREEHVLSLAGLPPAFDGYRILQIADPHFDTTPALPPAILGALVGVAADLCVLTGDFRAAERGPFTETGILGHLRAVREQVPAPDGHLVTLGNHDTAEMVAPFERLGLRVLGNESLRLHRAGETITVTGIDDVHRFYTPAAPAALARHDPRRFGLVLAHSADMAGEAAAAGHRLYLCGHTHGGQVCLPGGRAVITHLGRHRAFYRGFWRLDGLLGYTSRGAGLSTLPVRFNCPPEVTLFTLRRP